MGEIFLLTGTDTGVGKTYAGTLILEKLIGSGIHAFAMKPVESGCVETSDGGLIPLDAKEYFFILDDGSLTLEDLCIYRYREPVSPNLAAKMEGIFTDPDTVKSKILEESEKRDVVLVEGAGGIMVEIADGYSFFDLALELSMKVILVAPNRLGVLSHVALNVRFLRESGIRQAGIILNDLSPHPDPATRYNFEELRRVHGDAILGHISYNSRALPDDIITKLLGKIG